MWSQHLQQAVDGTEVVLHHLMMSDTQQTTQHNVYFNDWFYSVYV